MSAGVGITHTHLVAGAAGVIVALSVATIGEYHSQASTPPSASSVRGTDAVSLATYANDSPTVLDESEPFVASATQPADKVESQLSIRSGLRRVLRMKNASMNGVVSDAHTSAVPSSLQVLLKRLSVGSDGSLRWNGSPVSVGTTVGAQQEPTNLRRYSDGSVSDSSESPRRSGGGGVPSGADGKVEGHDHQIDTGGGTLDINGATRGVLQTSKGGTGRGNFSTGDLLVGNAGGGLDLLSLGNPGQVLIVESGNVTWGDLQTGTATGNVLFIGDSRYVKKSGDTMTGALTISTSVGTVGLNVLQTMSGNSIFASRHLASSGTLAIEGNATFDDGTLFVDAANNRVGIGTMTPNYAGFASTVLSVAGAEDVGIEIVSARTDNGGNMGNYDFIASSNTSNKEVAGLYSLVEGGTLGDQGANLNFYTKANGQAAGLRMTITGDGRTGIGKTAPASTLDVVGTISGARLSISNTANFSGAVLVKGNVGIGTTAPSAELHIKGANTANILAGTWAGANTYAAIGLANSIATGDYNFLSSTGDTSLYINRPTGADILFRENNGGTSQMIIKTGGNVGIGTTAPTAKLDVRGAIDVLGVSNGASYDYLRTGTWDMLGAKNDAGWGIILGGVEASEFTQLYFHTNGTEKARVTSAGDFGIGTTAPKAKLDVVGTISGSLITQNGAGNNYFLGNVGIGTTAPSALLSLGPAGGMKLATYDAGGGKYGLGVQGGLFEIISADSGVDFTFGHGASGLLSRLVTIKGSSGYFGIGTVNPSSRLTIYDPTNTTAGQQVRIGSQPGFDFTFGRNPNTGYMNFVSYQGFGYTFDGRVGMGTTAPKTELEVVGTISGARLSISQNANFSGAVLIRNTAPATKALIVRGAPSQSANLQEWQNSAGTALASVGADGIMNIAATGNYRSMLLTKGTGSNESAISFFDGTSGYSTFGAVGGTAYISTSAFIGTNVAAQFSNAKAYFSDSTNVYGSGEINAELGLSSDHAALHALSRGTASSTDKALLITGGGSYSDTQTLLSFNGAAIFNEQGNDADFRIEGDTDSSLLFADASTDRLGIGTTAPKAKLDVVGTVSGATLLGSNGITTKVVSGACTDSNAQATNGTLCIDSLLGRLYFRYEGAWHFAAQVAGFQIPHVIRNGKVETEGLEFGDRVVGRIDERLSDGSLHGVWEEFDLESELRTILTLHPELLGQTTSTALGSSMPIRDLQDATVHGELTVLGSVNILGDLQVQGFLMVGTDQAGTITIPAGATGVLVSFSKSWPHTPIISLTPNWPVISAVTVRSVSGFTIAMAAPAPRDVTMSWFAVASVGGESALMPSVLNSDVVAAVTTSVDGDQGHTGSGESLIPFYVDEQGVPLTGDLIVDACLRNQTPLDGDGQPYNCSRYHDGFVWTYGTTSFVWNTHVDPPLLQLPDGYAAVTTSVSTGAEPDPTIAVEPTTSTGSDTVPSDNPTLPVEPNTEIETTGETVPSDETTPEVQPSDPVIVEIAP